MQLIYNYKKVVDTRTFVSFMCCAEFRGVVLFLLLFCDKKSNLLKRSPPR